MTRIRGKREAERVAYDEKRERERVEWLQLVRTTGPYHGIGIEGIAAQFVCHLCSAVVVSREQHSEWHESLGQEMPV